MNSTLYLQIERPDIFYTEWGWAEYVLKPREDMDSTLIEFEICILCECESIFGAWNAIIKFWIVRTLVVICVSSEYEFIMASLAK